MKIADFLISVMQKIGISEGFSLVGGMSMHLNCAAGNRLRIIYANHEQAVVASADGYAKAADFRIPGLAMVTSGPGITNTLTSLTSAYFDSVPLILISGQVKSADINLFGVRSFGAQEVDHHALLSPITKLSFSYHPTMVTNENLAKNLALSMIGRKGPVHIDIPLDVQAMEGKKDEDVQEVLSIYKSLLERDGAQSCVLPSELISLVNSAQRPLIVLGNASRIASISGESISKLIDHLGFPVLLTWASMDLLDYDNPKVFGCAGGLSGVHSNRIIQAADLIIFLGVRLDLLTTGFNPQAYGKNATRFVFDCDEAELRKFSGKTGFTCVLSDIRAAVRALLETPICASNALSFWIAQCQTWQNENQKCEESEFSTLQLNTYHVASLIAQSDVTRYVVPTASGYAIEGFARFYKTTNGSRFSWAGHVLGSMGLAIPSAIGASLRLKKTVACVDGDGGFLLNMQELYTLRANPDIYIVFFILNNRGYASISQSQTRNFQNNFGASTTSGLAEVDFEILAKIADLKYLECRTYESLKDAISCLNSESRVLINIFLDGDNYRGPAITTKFDAQGRPFSTELEDISWR